MKEKTHRYQLEKYKRGYSKTVCPKCKKQKTFTRYIDIETNQYLSNEVGICDRLSKCGYHYTPKQYFEDNGKVHKSTFVYKEVKEIKLRSYLPKNLINTNYKDNALYSFLISKFDNNRVNDVMERYKIGSSDKWKRSTIFYQIDKYGNYRTGKIMQYSELTGKRIKEPYNRIAWLHTECKDYNLEQSMFGSHLVNVNDDTPICVVESEKTALIMAISEPSYIWLATGGLSNLKRDKMHFGYRSVALFPDSGCADVWAEKVKGIPNINICRDYDNELNGVDLADIVINESV